MSIELRSRAGAAEVHSTVGNLRPRPVASARRVAVRRVLATTLAAAVTVVAVIAILRTIGPSDDKTEDRLVDRPNVNERDEPLDGDERPSRGRPDSRRSTYPDRRSTERSTQGTAGADIGGVSGDLIAVVIDSATEVPEIWVMAIDGSGRKRLAAGFDPDWSPDGNRIVFSKSADGAVRCADTRNVANTENCEIWMMNADGTDQHMIRTGWAPDWAPDGRRIVFVAGDGSSQIFAMDADGSRPTQLTNYEEGAPVPIFAPDWSPNGKRIMFSRYETCGSACWINNLYVMNVDGSGKEFVANYTIDAKWSGDGERIVFQRHPWGGHGNFEIFTVRPDGSDLRRLTNDAKTQSPMDNYDWNPDWTPDGRIIFARDPDGPTGWGTCYAVSAVPECSPSGGPAPSQIFLMDADGSDRVLIGEDRSATFAPRTG